MRECAQTTTATLTGSFSIRGNKGLEFPPWTASKTQTSRRCGRNISRYVIRRPFRSRFALVLIVARKAGHSSAIDDVLIEFEIPAEEFDRAVSEYEAFERSVKEYNDGNN